MQFNDDLHMRGAVHLDVYRKSKLIQSEDDHNLIVVAGRGALAKLLGGDRSGGIVSLGVGSGSAATQDSDIGLTDCVLIPIGPVNYDSTSVTFNFTIETDQANGSKIHEFGLFFSDGTMFSRRVRKSVIEKEDDITITGYWRIYL